ncbi:MAG: hypothetical protein U0T81_18440 [Saprospiraceae bacterium]
MIALRTQKCTSGFPQGINKPDPYKCRSVLPQYYKYYQETGCFLRLNISLSSGVLLNPQASPGFTLSNISSSGLTSFSTPLDLYLPNNNPADVLCQRFNVLYHYSAQYIYKDQKRD